MNLIPALTPLRLKLALIAAPMALAGAYYAFFAADRYVSEATVTVRQANQESGPLPGVALLLGGINPPARDDTLYVREYIHSLVMLKRLDERLNLRAHFEAETKDPLFRLYGGTSQEWFLEYYRSRVEVLFDEVASLLTIRVQGFEPEFAKRLADAILEESEQFVNSFSHRMAREQLRFAEEELERSNQRLRKAKSKVVEFQNKYKILDPTAQARASGVLTAELQGELAKLETELRTLRSYLNDDSYQVKGLRNQIAALREQLNVERSRGTAGRNSDRLNELASQFRDLGLQAAFTEDAYKLSLAAVENARIDATRKIKSLVVIEAPARAESAEYPRRAYNLATLFVVCCLLYAVTRLIVTTIRDHQD